MEGEASGQAASVEEEGNRTARLPRWTRQEILVLIQGKRVAENRVRRGRTAGLAFGSGQVLEPKWASVSSYCKRHGVNRGPVQCRKRWSNLAGDFKKIKEWESQITSGAEEKDSFWVMRNDLRREKKLPGFFDREVYEILDSDNNNDNNNNTATTPPPPPVFDSGRYAGPEEGLFSDFEQQQSTQQQHDVHQPLPLPASEKKRHQHGTEETSAQGATHEKQPPSHPEVGTTQEGRKRKRLASEGDDEMYLQHQLVETLERNGRMLSSQLEVQNTNFRSDMELRKDHGNSLIAVLDKLADALGKIADKL